MTKTVLKHLICAMILFLLKLRYCVQKLIACYYLVRTGISITSFLSPFIATLHTQCYCIRNRRVALCLMYIIEQENIIGLYVNHTMSLTTLLCNVIAMFLHRKIMVRENIKQKRVRNC